MVQAHSAIPFPSSPPKSMHVSPTVPSQWDSSTSQVELSYPFSSPTPTQTPSSPQLKAQQQTPERPSQPHTPLTPPLTPASSAFLSGSGGDNIETSSAFATPARGPAAPPPTPASACLLSHSTSTSRMGPTSPVAVGINTSPGTALGGGWLAPNSPRRTRPIPHRLEVGTNESSGRTLAAVGSPLSDKSERSVGSGESLLDPDRATKDMRIGDSNARDGVAGDERYLLIGNVPKDAKPEHLKDAFRPCGDVKGICLRFQETEGIVILAFHDCRFTVHAELHITAPGQTYFNGKRLRAEKMGAGALRRLMGDSDFVNETEGEVLVTADGKIDADSLQSIVSGFGELRGFSQVNMANAQAYIAEFYDCRNAKNAMDALNGRSIFGIRLCLVPMHTATTELLNRVPFPQNAGNSKQSRHAGSQPASPLSMNSPFSRLHADPFNFSSRQEQVSEHDEVNKDTSNSSPFHGTRALPPPAPPLHSHSFALHGGNARRISTGSVGVLPGGTALHQSTSEQDLRRRAAANNVACVNAQDGWMGDHMRRTSDTFCFDALRRAAADLSGPVGQGGLVGMGPLGRPRTRAISDSSASTRVVSPSDGFSTAGMDVGILDHVAYERSTTSEHITGNGTQEYYRDDRDSDAERSVHSRIPTASDSSLGAPHTPSPGPVAYNVSPYYPGSASLLGMPGILAPAHNGAGQYYLTSPLTNAAGLRYGYPPQAPTFSPGGLSVHSPSSSPSSLHSPSNSSLLYSPSHGHLLSARGAVDVTRDPPTERNQVDLDRIAAGLDTRTTVMIKNIPNKLSDRDLIEFIGRVCPRKIDFLYLRMDFQNGCNVGYAFVNFIHVQDLLHFARTKLGVKWNMFSSEKVLQMSYANYQGKEALVEKFKNSCVMDERESWRPKIFYSSGAHQGMPEPFPAPTHYRRKERSAQNRGALFLPSAHGSGGGERGERGAGGPSMLSSPFCRPNQHPQNLARQDRF